MAASASSRLLLHLKTLLLFSALATTMLAGTQSGAGTASAAPEYPSAFTDVMLNTFIPADEDASSTAITAAETAYFQGKIDGTTILVGLIGQNPGWTTDFGIKTTLEQTGLVTKEQQIVIYALAGNDPGSSDFQYWQGYEDAIQQTLDAMNTWPGSGGAVLGTTVEYAFSLPVSSGNGLGSSVTSSAPGSSGPAQTGSASSTVPGKPGPVTRAPSTPPPALRNLPPRQARN